MSLTRRNCDIKTATYFQDIRKEEQGQLTSTADDTVTQLDDVALGYKATVRRHQVGRTIFDVVEDIEEDHLAFGFPFVFVDVRHDVLNGGQSSFQFSMIRIVLGGVLEEVCGLVV
jgi:hypothetical protein